MLVRLLYLYMEGPMMIMMTRHSQNTKGYIETEKPCYASTYYYYHYYDSTRQEKT